MAWWHTDPFAAAEDLPKERHAAETCQTDSCQCPPCWVQSPVLRESCLQWALRQSSAASLFLTVRVCVCVCVCVCVSTRTRAPAELKLQWAGCQCLVLMDSAHWQHRDFQGLFLILACTYSLFCFDYSPCADKFKQSKHCFLLDVHT